MGYLLLKNPARVHSFDLTYGKAHVFYPELSDTKSSACLLIDIDPVGLVRGRHRVRAKVLSINTSMTGHTSRLRF